ncbi:MAG: hypothetical protein K0V04_44155 [Deltaproteobacteria bacterium]|nr:hypothetical protein [Deltaproteobacteria bacterium]
MNTALAWVVTYLLHSTILVLAAWLLERRWRDRPERMSAVWKTALVGGVFTASLQLALAINPVGGQWDLASRDSVPSDPGLAAGAVAVASAAPAVEPSPVQMVGEPVIVALAPAAPETFPRSVVLAVGEPDAEPSAAVAPVHDDHDDTAWGTPTPSTQPPAVDTASLLSAATPWIVGFISLGAVLGLFSVIAAFVALRRALSGRSPVREGMLPTLLEGLKIRAGIGRAVPLTLAPQLRVPMAVGVVKPEIVVPWQAAAALSVEHQESLLAHELAHVLRRDPTWRLIALLMERVLFFQPLNRVASRHLAQSAEYLCDDWAAQHTRQPLALASCLTEIAGWVSQPMPAAAMMAGPRSILGRRVHRLLAPASARTAPRWLPLALGIPVLGVMLLAPGVSARAGDDGPQVVIVDEDGRRRAYATGDDGVIVLSQQDGQLRIQHGDDGSGTPLTRRQARELSREADRARRGERRRSRDAQREADKELRKARKALQKQMRQARRKGEPGPSRAEAKALLRGHQHRTHTQMMSNDDHLEVHLTVPGEVEVHGSVALDPEVLEAVQAFGQIEGAQMLEALGELEGLEEIEELEPVLELFEMIEDGEIDVVIDGDGGEELHVRLRPGNDDRRNRSRSRNRRRSKMDAKQKAKHKAEARAWLRTRDGDHELRIRRHEQVVEAQAHAREQAHRRQQHAQRDIERAREDAQRQAERRLERLQRDIESRARRGEAQDREAIDRQRAQIRELREHARQQQRKSERRSREATPLPRRTPAPRPTSPAALPHVRMSPPAPPAPPALVRPAPAAPRSPKTVRRSPSPVPPKPTVLAVPRSGRSPAPPSPESTPVVWLSAPEPPTRCPS